MRHPDDPDIVSDSKAAAAFCLGVLAAVTGFMVGGLVPATIALVLARQASTDLDTGAGWRAGDRYLHWARRLAWTGIGTAVCAIVLIVVVRLLQDAGTGQRDFPATVD